MLFVVLETGSPGDSCHQRRKLDSPDQLSNERFLTSFALSQGPDPVCPVLSVPFSPPFTVEEIFHCKIFYLKKKFAFLKAIKFRSACTLIKFLI